MTAKVTSIGKDEVIQAWWEHYRLDVEPDHHRGGRYFWAWSLVSDHVVGRRDPLAEGNVRDALVGVDPVDLLVDLAEPAPDVAGLAYLGAGPVEDYLLRHPAADIDRIDEQARRHERFRIALRCAWFDGELPADQARRLRRFGPPL